MRGIDGRATRDKAASLRDKDRDHRISGIRYMSVEAVRITELDSAARVSGPVGATADAMPKRSHACL